MPYSRVISRGLKEVADGRVFVIENCRGNDIEPSVSPPGSIEWRPEDKIIGLAKPGTSFVCAQCGELMKRQMLCHTYNWMYTAFVCPNHPSAYILDFFPKTSGDTCWDYTDAFMANIDPVSNPALPKGVTITNYAGPEDRYSMYLASTKKDYYLTPEGIEKPAIVSLPGKPLSRLAEFLAKFSHRDR